MRILLVGSGGREHALAWKLIQSPKCDKLFCAPGNAGISQIAECVDIPSEDIESLTQFAKNEGIDLVVIGPEAPLVLGLADRMRAAGIKAFGPSGKAAELEGSKGFMKDIVSKYNISTAKYGRFTDINEATKFIKNTGVPIVVKTDGLAAGKGVIICETEQEAIKAASNMLSGSSFGEAGKEIVIEEFLDGEEISYFTISDGKTILPLTSAQDHKRVGEGDTGPNTGGMGAYSPAHFITPQLEKQIINEIIQPTIDGMAKEGIPYTGVLFAGLMVKNNKAKLLEFNVRFGDPECQEIMMRLDSDLVDILEASTDEKLDKIAQTVKWKDEVALCVVMAANGYPGSYVKNTPIYNIEEAEKIDNVCVFHAGTAYNDNKEIISIGGRVLGVTALGKDFAQAKEKAYDAVKKIKWDEGFYRRDIGWRAIS